MLTRSGYGPSGFCALLALARACPQKKRDRISVDSRLSHPGFQKQLPSQGHRRQCARCSAPGYLPGAGGDGWVAAKPKRLPSPDTGLLAKAAATCRSRSRCIFELLEESRLLQSFNQQKPFFNHVFLNEEEQGSRRALVACYVASGRRLSPGSLRNEMVVV